MVGASAVVAWAVLVGAVVVGAVVVGAVVAAAVVEAADGLATWRPPQPTSSRASAKRIVTAGLGLGVVGFAIVLGSFPPRRRCYRRVTAAVAAGALLATVAGVGGCGAGSGSDAARPSGSAPGSPVVATSAPVTSAPVTSTAVPSTAVPSTPIAIAAPTTAASTTTPSTTTMAAPGPARFASSVGPVTALQLGPSWRPGCPVDPTQLRLLHLSYWGFDGVGHDGTMVVNATVASAVIAIFTTLYDHRFPIREMVPVSSYGGDDNVAAAADDTSGFNCRYAVAPGPPQWSVHAFGEAIDVNDVENPYFDGPTVIPPAGTAYRDRRDVRSGMAVTGGPVVAAFSAVGWQWGGRWTASPDYQHFSSTGG